MDNCELARPTQTEIQRPVAKAKILSLRITDAEYATLERAAWQAGRTLADWAREKLLRAESLPDQACSNQFIFAEMVGLQLLVTNLLFPLAKGERIAADEYQKLIQQIQATKVQTAEELLAKRARKEK